MNESSALLVRFGNNFSDSNQQLKEEGYKEGGQIPNFKNTMQKNVFITTHQQYHIHTFAQCLTSLNRTFYRYLVA